MKNKKFYGQFSCIYTVFASPEGRRFIFEDGGHQAENHDAGAHDLNPDQEAPDMAAPNPEENADKKAAAAVKKLAKVARDKPEEIKLSSGAKAETVKAARGKQASLVYLKALCQPDNDNPDRFDYEQMRVQLENTQTNDVALRSQILAHSARLVESAGLHLPQSHEAINTYMLTANTKKQIGRVAGSVEHALEFLHAMCQPTDENTDRFGYLDAKVAIETAAPNDGAVRQRALREAAVLAETYGQKIPDADDIIFNGIDISRRTRKEILKAADDKTTALQYLDALCKPPKDQTDVNKFDKEKAGYTSARNYIENTDETDSIKRALMLAHVASFIADQNVPSTDEVRHEVRISREAQKHIDQAAEDKNFALAYLRKMCNPTADNPDRFRYVSAEGHINALPADDIDGRKAVLYKIAEAIEAYDKTAPDAEAVLKTPYLSPEIREQLLIAARTKKNSVAYLTALLEPSKDNPDRYGYEGAKQLLDATTEKDTDRRFTILAQFASSLPVNALKIPGTIEQTERPLVAEKGRTPRQKVAYMKRFIAAHPRDVTEEGFHEYFGISIDAKPKDVIAAVAGKQTDLGFTGDDIDGVLGEKTRDKILEGTLTAEVLAGKRKGAPDRDKESAEVARQIKKIDVRKDLHAITEQIQTLHGKPIKAGEVVYIPAYAELGARTEVIRTGKSSGRGETFAVIRADGTVDRVSISDVIDFENAMLKIARANQPAHAAETYKFLDGFISAIATKNGKNNVTVVYDDGREEVLPIKTAAGKHSDKIVEYKIA